jgi:putative peptidoglycan lipid II flippase
VTTSGALARAGVIVSGAFLASRALGWLRVSITTAIFGASPDLDAFYAAFRIPDLVFQLVAAGALGSALVPVVASLLAHDDQARAWRVVSTVADLMLVGLLVLSLAFAVAAPWLVPLITPGFDVIQTELTIRLTRIMLLGPIFLALGAVASSLLNASGRFGAAALAPVAYNGAIIVAAVLLGPILGVGALAIGVVVGSLAHLAVQLPGIRSRTGFIFEPIPDVADPMARKVFGLMAPRAIGLGVAQITFIVNTTLASTLGPGAITAYTVGFTVLQLPLGLIAVPLGVVLLPTMSRAVAVGEKASFAAMVDRSLRMLAYVMLFLTALMIVARDQIVRLLFEYGRFGTTASNVAADTLMVFTIGLAAHAMIAVLARAFYATHDTRTPVLAAFVSVVVNVAVSVLTVGPLGLSGLALGIALGAWVEVVILLWRLHGVIPGVGVGREVRWWIVFSGGAALAGAGAWLVLRFLRELLGADPGKIALAVELAVASVAAVAIYLAYSRLLGLAEPATVIALARRAVRGGGAG